MAKKNRKAEAPERKQSAFPTVVVIYLWILLILGGGALWVLRDFLQAYELYRPSYCVADYETALGETVPASALRALDSVDARIMSDEEKNAWVQALLRDASLSKDSSQSWEEHQVYFIQSADGQTLGSVVFEPVDTAEFRMPVWGVTEESFDFSAYYRSTGITVPAGWQVRLGELPLGPESVAEDQIPFALLAECYLHYENLPTMVRYETPPFLGDAQLRVFDGQGREVPAEQLTEEAFLDDCPDEMRQQVNDFVPEFLHLYVLFSADIRDSARYYYNLLTPMVQPGSQLAERMKLAFEGFGYSATKDVSLESVTINRITDLGGGLYLADISYTTQVTGHQGAVPVNDRILLVLRTVNGQLLADALYYQ